MRLWSHTLVLRQKRSQSKSPTSPHQLKFKVTKLVGKVMVTVFWDADSVLLVDFLDLGWTINGDYYASTGTSSSHYHSDVSWEAGLRSAPPTRQHACAQESSGDDEGNQLWLSCSPISHTPPTSNLNYHLFPPQEAPSRLHFTVIVKSSQLWAITI